MTEQEIRKQVKKEFRKSKVRDFLEWLKHVGGFILLIAVVTIIAFPTIAHLSFIQYESKFLFLNYSHSAVIWTGICSIPFILIDILGIIMICIGVCLDISEKIKEHKKDIEDVVEYRMKQQEKEDK